MCGIVLDITHLLYSLKLNKQRTKKMLSKQEFVTMDCCAFKTLFLSDIRNNLKWHTCCCINVPMQYYICTNIQSWQ